MGASKSNSTRLSIPESEEHDAAPSFDSASVSSPGVEAVFRLYIAMFTACDLSVTGHTNIHAGLDHHDPNDNDASAVSLTANENALTDNAKADWLAFEATAIRKDITPDNAKQISRLYRTNRFFRETTQPHIELLTQQLIALILNAREIEAKALIEACPFLLERRATVTDPVGRVYQDITAYEAALYAGDIQMCKMMHPFFGKLGEYGEKMRLEQYHKVYPDGVKAVVNAQQTYDFTYLIEAISIAPERDVINQVLHIVTYTKLCKAITRFRDDFARFLKNEPHANMNHLFEALELYAKDKRLEEWGTQPLSLKFDLFLCQVIGFVQIFLPACEKQAFHQGLYNVVKLRESLRREPDSVCYRGHSLDITRDYSGCGFENALSHHAAPVTRMHRRKLVGSWAELVGERRSDKNNELERLMHPQKSHIPSCIIQ